MTTLTSFSSLEISELEVKGLILSLFQVILFFFLLNNHTEDHWKDNSLCFLGYVLSHCPPATNHISFLS